MQGRARQSEGNTIEVVPAASLLLDYAIYPRNRLNMENVSSLVTAAATGAILPPVIAARRVGRRRSKDGRVVDGFHRVTGKLREGDDAMIEVEWRDYPSVAAMFEDALALNSIHGYKLTGQDATRIVHLGRDLGLSIERIASAMHSPVAELERRGANIGVLVVPSRKQVRGQTIVPLKRTYSNLRGKTVTPKQVEANAKATGHPQSFLLGQVITILGSGAIAWETPLVRTRILELRDVLNALDIPA